MPYANKQDRADNRRWKYNAKQLEKFRQMGLEPLDVNDVWSNLECLTCGKVTGRGSAHMFRHFEGCPMIEATTRITGNSPRTWNRLKKST